MRQINVYKSVEVDVDFEIDVDEYKDEILEALEDEEITAEAARRGIGCSGSLYGEDFRRFLCDMLDFGYTASPEAIIAEITSRLKR